MPARSAARSCTNPPLPAHPSSCELVPKACCSLWQLTAHTHLCPVSFPGPHLYPCRRNASLLSLQRAHHHPGHLPLWPPPGSAQAVGWTDPLPNLYKVLPASMRTLLGKTLFQSLFPVWCREVTCLCMAQIVGGQGSPVQFHSTSLTSFPIL